MFFAANYITAEETSPTSNTGTNANSPPPENTVTDSGSDILDHKGKIEITDETDVKKSPKKRIHKIEDTVDVNNRPQVNINGIAVLNVEESRKFELSKRILPLALQNDNARIAVENRKHIIVYEHSPSFGDKFAPVTIVELTDLGCLECNKKLRETDKVINNKKFKNKIRYVNIYLPEDRFNTSNPAAFYSRLASEAGVFWEYRKKVIASDEIGETTFSDKLFASGVEPVKLRNLIRKKSRQFYRELDADAMLVKNMNETLAPTFYVNGIKVGGGIRLENLHDVIVYELKYNGSEEDKSLAYENIIVDSNPISKTDTANGDSDKSSED